MRLTRDEVEFLSAWAREEWEPACYQLPCHRVQLAHGVAAAHLAVLIKAWTESEGKKDQDILPAGVNASPPWPWSTAAEFDHRLSEASAGRSPAHETGTRAQERDARFAGR
jgi:hypothetical protein